MADDLPQLAKSLRTAWFYSPVGTSDDNLWMALATAARERLSAAPPAAPTERPTCATCPYWAGDGDNDDSKLAGCRR
jgi:hypothetical protein